MASLHQLLSNVTDQVGCLAEEDDHLDRFDNLRCNLDLMHQAIVDMDGGNGDLLKVMANQSFEVKYVARCYEIALSNQEAEGAEATYSFFFHRCRTVGLQGGYFKDPATCAEPEG